MSNTNRVGFKDLKNSNLFVDTIYEGGTTGNTRDEVLSKLMHVSNSGGFRKCKKIVNGKKIDEPAYVCLFSTGEELEWRDELDRTLGRFIYWGDNRKAGNPICKTKLGGNAFLQDVFNNNSLGIRKKIAPAFVFQKAGGRDMIFLGLAVPGDRRIRPQDSLVAVWAQNNDGRYQNYKSIFTILDVPEIDRRWLYDLEYNDGYSSQYAPKVWKKWVDNATYTPLITEKNPIQYRRKNEQLPSPSSEEFKMLQAIIDYFPDPYDFEQCACKIAQIMDSNIIQISTTRRTRDGGKDANGKYRVGYPSNGIELDFALEAKRYDVNNSVGVKETSRLVSRIKNRQFGIIVTTSYVGDQAYKEIIEDQQPIIVISGKDIIEILMNAGINNLEMVNEWLKSNFS